MRNLRNKTKDQGGFTLIEMLVVVAIIAILVAVSIPMINNSLERARNATDAANERAAKAEGAIAYLTETLPTQLEVDGVTSKGKPITKLETCYYDAANGKLVGEKATDEIKNITPYGKCNNYVGSESSEKGHRDGIIKVEVTPDGKISLTWVIYGAKKLAGLHNSKVDD